MSELLTVKRPSRTQKLFSSIPKPRGYVPRNGLPMWEFMSLEHKIPRVPAPKGRIVYTRGTVGKPLMVKIQRDDFVPPNSGSTTMWYEPMHDHHLKRFFDSKVTRKHLRKTGQMTEDGEEICTIDVFNEYRLYLRSVHGELVDKERARLEALSREKRILALAQESAERDAKKASMWVTRKERARTKKQMEEQRKKDLLNKSLQQHQQHEQALAEYRRAQKNEMMAWSQALDKKIRECKVKSTLNVRQRTIRTIRKWQREEIFLRKQQREKKKRKAKKEQEVEKWFHQKAEFQLQKINLINSLLKLEEEERERSILERNLRFMKERERMNDLFQRIKHRREEKIKMEKRRKMSKLVTHVICDNIVPVVSDMQLNRKSVEETVNQAMQSFSATEKREASVAELLEETRSLLSRQSQMPLEIKSAFEQILDDTLYQVVRNKVDLELKQIIGRGLQTIEIVAPKKATPENGRPSTANFLPCPVSKGNDKVSCCQPMPIVKSKNESLIEQQRSSSIRKSLIEDVYYGLMVEEEHPTKLYETIEFWYSPDNWHVISRNNSS
ncbi:trichohyalin isoform X2 [Ischnura elegans]|uniref:trichohyalin isoform X2 n=1 Tax=Ischnura elegans TaxID=197161 RepID=UPI001ED8BE32|nr:trichohyalin isoform X2 [Ischnura elegans]